jgi:two-component system KDP operon response regulator KdpE
VSGTRILVVDDEPQILRALRSTLHGAGYEVDTATTAESALTMAATQPPDAVILDLVLPDGSGVDVCRELRQWTQVPVLVLSALGDEREKVAALDAGADDYVTKPFGVDELLARLRAVLRRGKAAGDSPVIEVGELRLDLDQNALYRNGELVQLTPHEFRLMRLFAQNTGKLLTHKAILKDVWGPAYQSESHYIHVYVSQLRRKVEQDATRPRYLLTEPGAGYRFVEPG